MIQRNTNTNIENRMHYGWMVAFGGFLTQIILMISLQTLPIIMAQVKVGLHLTNASAGTIMSVFGLTYAGCSFIWGYIADRFGARIAVTAAGVISALMVILFGLIGDSFTKAIIIFALVGFGVAGIYSATIPKLIGAWFHPSKRGRAMSLITPGGVLTAAALGIVAPKLSKAYGWQNTFVILGVVALACTILIYVIVRNRAADKGLTPIGSPLDVIVDSAPPAKEGGFGEVLKMRITWHLGIMYIFWQLAFMTVTVFLAVSVSGAGFTAAQAGLAVTIYSLCQLVGQQIWGPLSDRIERKFVIGIAGAWWAVFSIAYIFVYGSGLSNMYVVVGLMGVGMGMVPVLLASFTDYFPKEVRGTGAGVISTFAIVGRFFGPMVAGIVADATGKVSSVFGFAGAMMLIAVLIALTLPRVRNKTA